MLTLQRNRFVGMWTFLCNHIIAQIFFFIIFFGNLWISKLGSLNLILNVCLCAKSLQSCPSLCNHIDCSPPSSSVNGILQARILEWVAMPFFRGSSRPRDGRNYVSFVSCIGRQVSYHQHHLGSPDLEYNISIAFFFFTIAFPFTIIFLNKNVYHVLFNMYHMYIFICTYLNM